MSELITETKLRQLAGEWIGGGKTVVGPVRVKDRVLYRPLGSPESLLIESTPGAFTAPSNSIKEFLFPKLETLYQYRTQGRNIELIEPAAEFAEQLILAARPCDAAALPILDHVFNWDFADDFYNRRRGATTIVTLACGATDGSCFCTSVGLAPDATRGSDAILLGLGNGRFEVRCTTDKGRALVSGKTETSAESARPRRLPNPSSIPAQFARLSTVTSRTRSGPRTGGAAWHAEFVRSRVPPATASTLSTPERRPATPASGPGTLASSRSSPCTPPDTIRGRLNRRASDSAFSTSFLFIRKSSARSSAPAAVIAYATARWAWAC